jgi:hypothetical protein
MVISIRAENEKTGDWRILDQKVIYGKLSLAETSALLEKFTEEYSDELLLNEIITIETLGRLTDLEMF